MDPWPGIVHDQHATAGLRHPALDGRGRDRLPFGRSAVELLPDAVLEGKPYPLEALFLYYSNPLFARNNPEKFARAFDKIPLIVSFSPYMDESAHQSDYILPDHTYLERWDAATPAPFEFRAAVGVRRPVVEPLYDTRHSGDALIRIAGELGGSMRESFPWKNFRTAMEERVGGVADSGRGFPKGSDRKDFLKKWTQTGYWHDDPAAPEDWKAAFRTPSGKFEFWSARAEEGVRAFGKSAKAGEGDSLKRLGKNSLEEACLPHAEEPRYEGDIGEFPLVLMPYKSVTHAEGGGANIPVLRQLAGLRKGLRAAENWQSWVELSARTASRLGIARGDKVWVESPAGKIAARALPSRSIPEDLALMELGLGHTQFGRFAQGKGANPKNLTAASVDPWSGHSPLCNTRVRVTKA
jgi:anaerobic selenocysteine-containing dehydrogenase